MTLNPAQVACGRQLLAWSLILPFLLLSACLLEASKMQPQQAWLMSQIRHNCITEPLCHLPFPLVAASQGMTPGLTLQNECKAPALPRSSDISASLPWRDLDNFPLKSQSEEGTSRHNEVWARQKCAFSSSSIVGPSPNKASLKGIVDSTGI